MGDRRFFSSLVRNLDEGIGHPVHISQTNFYLCLSSTQSCRSLNLNLFFLEFIAHELNLSQSPILDGDEQGEIREVAPHARLRLLIPVAFKLAVPSSLPPPHSNVLHSLRRRTLPHVLRGTEPLSHDEVEDGEDVD